MTEGGESRGDTTDAKTDTSTSDTPVPPPLPVLSAAEWRAFFASLPPRTLWRVLLKEPVSHARIFAGFRPAPEMLRTHPIVKTRLVDEAVKHPAFAKVVREIAPPPAEAAPEENAPAKENAAEPEPRRAKTDDEAVAKEKIRDLRGVVRTQVARIKELEAALVQAERERETAKAETASHRLARQAAEEETRRAEAEAERQKRDRDREARRAALAKEKSPAEAPSLSRAIAPALVPPASAPEKLLHDAAQRLILENRFGQVSDLCREAMRLLSEGANASAGERGRLHTLYASALYGSHNTAVGEEQDRLAAGAFLDNGDVLSAADAIARRFAQGTTGVRAADVPLLRRLTLLAPKLGQMEGVQTAFFRLRITAPTAFRRLQEASGVSPRTGGTRPVSGGAAFAELLGGSGSSNSAGGGAIGPDEAVSLPVPTRGGAPAITGVTPRQLVRAVESGNVALVTNVHAALTSLREQNTQSTPLANALLEAVTELSPVSVCPFLQKTRPVYVDASNIARYNPDPLALEAPPRVKYLRLMRDFLLRRGYFPVTFIADANLRFHVDDKSAYLEMLEKQMVREAPPGMTADEVLIREAYENHAPLITNDRLAEWGESARRIERVGFLFSASDISLTPF